MNAFRNLFGKVKTMVKKNKNKGGFRKNLGAQKNTPKPKPTPPKKDVKVAKVDEKKAAETVTELKKTVKKNPMKLRFSPTAWAKLLYLRDYGDTEVGGFGITLPDDLLYVDDFILIKQECTSVTVEFDDDDVADFMMDMVEDGLKPEQFMRIWIHTHPSMSATPSGTDEETFDRVFSKCDWAVMAIVSDTGSQYCRLQINGGPFPGAFDIPIEVDFSTYEFPASDTEAWKKEYDDNVTECVFTYTGGYHGYNWPNYHGYQDNAYGHYTGIYQPNGVKVGGASGVKSNGGHMGFDKKNVVIPSTAQNDESTVDEDDLLPGWSDVMAEDEEGFLYEPDMEVLTEIPDELLQHITPNQMSLLENMNPLEREYVIDDMKKKMGIED